MKEKEQPFRVLATGKKRGVIGIKFGKRYTLEITMKGEFVTITEIEGDHRGMTFSMGTLSKFLDYYTNIKKV